MLRQITIHNFAIFKDATIETGNGYNVITGESGAGKSVVVNALSLICGARAYKEMIRSGEEFAVVEAVFKVSGKKRSFLKATYGISDDLLVITRKIFAEKSSECRINGKIRNLADITGVSSILMDIHGQYENQSLANSENHLKYLDSFAAGSLSGKISEYRESLVKYDKNMKFLLSNAGSDSDRERNKEIIEFQLKEIDSADLLNFNENELSQKRSMLENSEKFKKITKEAYTWLENDNISTADSIKKAVKIISALPENNKLNKIMENLNESYYLLSDASVSIREFSNSIEYSQEEYDSIGDTFDILDKLKRKYGKTIGEIMEFRKNISNELENILNYNLEYEKILMELKDLETKLDKIDIELSKIRKKTSEDLKTKLVAELFEMGMKDSVFKIEFTKKENINSLGFMIFPSLGRDDCEFKVSLNKGIKPMTLGKVASGGEMSRIMLAFKTVFTYKEGTETVIFDEIDSGISGEASIAVGGKLKRLSKNKQIICITHLPQIAVRAENHYVISKETEGEIATASITRIIEKDEIIRVIASLTDGETVSDEGIDHARKLYKQYN